MPRPPPPACHSRPPARHRRSAPPLASPHRQPPSLPPPHTPPHASATRPRRAPPQHPCPRSPFSLPPQAPAARPRRWPSLHPPVSRVTLAPPCTLPPLSSAPRPPPHHASTARPHRSLPAARITYAPLPPGCHHCTTSPHRDATRLHRTPGRPRSKSQPLSFATRPCRTPLPLDWKTVRGLSICGGFRFGNAGDCGDSLLL